MIKDKDVVSANVQEMDVIIGLRKDKGKETKQCKAGFSFKKGRWKRGSLFLEPAVIFPYFELKSQENLDDNHERSLLCTRPKLPT